MDQHHDFYQKLRARIRAHLATNTPRTGQAVEFLLAAPDLFHLIVRLAADPRVPISQKAKLGLAIAYFLSPMDFIPELFLGPVGYMDDVAIAALVVDGIVKAAGPDIVASHWAGDGDLLALLQRILAQADKILGARIFGKLKAKVGK